MKIPYYNGQPVLDRGYFLNLLKGMRGVGKTFFYKNNGIEKWRTKKRQFIWLRRFKTEIDQDFRQTFFDDLVEAAKDPDTDFKPAHRKYLLGMKWKLENNAIYLNDEIAGYYYALSTTSGKKSKPFPKVDDLYFDEYLLKRKSPYHYLPDEFIIFMEFISTVARLRTGFHAYLIGNNMSWSDPYSLALGIRPTDKRFTVYQNPRNGKKNILMEMYDDPEFKKIVYGTEFGQIIEGTSYGDYAIENASLDDNNDFIATRPKNTTFLCGIRYGGVYYGFWLDRHDGRIYASRKYDSTSPSLFSLTRDDHTVNTYFLKNKRSFNCMRVLDNVYAAGDLRFEDYQVKKAAEQILNYI